MLGIHSSAVADQGVGGVLLRIGHALAGEHDGAQLQRGFRRSGTFRSVSKRAHVAGLVFAHDELEVVAARREGEAGGVLDVLLRDLLAASSASLTVSRTLPTRMPCAFLTWPTMSSVALSLSPFLRNGICEPGTIRRDRDEERGLAGCGSRAPAGRAETSVAGRSLRSCSSGRARGLRSSGVGSLPARSSPGGTRA